jgi:hypothetical protein
MDESCVKALYLTSKRREIICEFIYNSIGDGFGSQGAHHFCGGGRLIQVGQMDPYWLGPIRSI